TRARRPLQHMEGWLPAAPTVLRSGEEMHSLHHHWAHALHNSVEIAQECAFDLNLVAPDLPPFPVPDGHTETTWLRHLTYAGAHKRYGDPARARKAYDLIDHEL